METNAELHHCSPPFLFKVNDVQSDINVNKPGRREAFCGVAGFLNEP